MASKIKVDQIDTTLGTGNVTIDPDNNTLVVDTDNSRVGIGTSSPTTEIDVAGNATIGTNTGGIINLKGGSTTSPQVRFFDGGTGRARIGVPTGQTYLSLSGSDTLAADVMIDSDGRVGIGTTNPDTNSQLHVRNDTADAKITLQTSESYDCYINFSGATSEASIGYEPTSNTMVFANASDSITSNARMRIDTAGRVLIGTTETSVTSTDDGIVLTQDGNLIARRAGTVAYWTRLSVTGTHNVHLFYANTSPVGSISVNSSSTAYNTTSDYRLKENVVVDWDATTRLKQLNPVRFNFIAEPDTTVDGFLAHEVQSVVPEAITGTHDEVDDDGNPVYQGIDQGKIVPLLVKSLQEALDKIDTLETRLEALENA